MPDFLTPPERSERMARIRSKDTSPELAVRRALHAAGFRFRLDDRRLPGRPDIVLRKHKAVIFVHGCFWHRHAGCKVASTPKSKTEFWQGKFDRNVERDVRVGQELAALGWRVFVVWECQVASQRRVEQAVEALAALLRSDECQS